MSDEQEQKSVTAILRKSYRQSVRQSARNIETYNKRQSMRALSIRGSRNMSIRDRGAEGSVSVQNKPKGRQVSINSNRN